MALPCSGEILETETGPLFLPPTDLPSDELIKCLDWLWQDRKDYFAAGNLTIYYRMRQLKSEDFRGPDFFVVSNTEKRPRKSWVVWEAEPMFRGSRSHPAILRR